MKYIISESRLDKVIDAYLNSEFKGKKVVIIKHPHIGNRFYWVVDDIVVAEFGNFFKDICWLDKKIFNRFMGTFSIPFKEVGEQIRKYLYRQHNIDIPIIRGIDFNHTRAQEIYQRYGKK